MLFRDEDEAGEVHTEPAPVPVAEIPAVSRRRSVEAPSSPPIFHPLAYRGVVAAWPVEWRERWGRRANELEESGLSWRDAETQAFVEVWNLRRQDRPAHAAHNALATTNAEQN
jgi:hypothetical protein